MSHGPEQTGSPCLTNIHEVGRPSRRHGSSPMGTWGQPLGTRSLGRHLGRCLADLATVDNGNGHPGASADPGEQGETEGAGPRSCGHLGTTTRNPGFRRWTLSRRPRVPVRAQKTGVVGGALTCRSWAMLPIRGVGCQEQTRSPHAHARMPGCQGGELGGNQCHPSKPGSERDGHGPFTLPPNITLEALADAAKQEKEDQAVSEGRNETVFICR